MTTCCAPTLDTGFSRFEITAKRLLGRRSLLSVTFADREKLTLPESGDPESDEFSKLLA